MKLNSAKKRFPKGKRFFAAGGRGSAVGRAAAKKTQGIKYHHKFAFWRDMICKAEGKGRKSAETAGNGEGRGRFAFADTHPTNRGFAAGMCARPAPRH